MGYIIFTLQFEWWNVLKKITINKKNITCTFLKINFSIALIKHNAD